MPKLIIKFFIFSILLFGLVKLSIFQIEESGRVQSEQNLRDVAAMKKRQQARKDKVALEDSKRTVYDPKLCKTDAGGMVYWAAGTHVFRFPYRPEVKLYSRRDTRFEGYVDIPNVDQNDLEGCPNNPLRGGFMPYSDQYVKAWWKEVANEALRNRIAGYKTAIRSTRSAKSYSLYKKPPNNNKCFKRVEGLLECFSKFSDDRKPSDLRGRRLELYFTDRNCQENIYYGTAWQPISDGGIQLEIIMSWLLFEFVDVTLSIKTFPEKVPFIKGFEIKAREYLQKAHYKNYSIK